MISDDYFKNKLPQRLIKDFFDGRMYSEADMEACAYLWTRRDLVDQTERLNVHRQLRVESKSPRVPDMVLVDRDRVTAIVELKFVVDQPSPWSALQKDFDKAKEFRAAFPSLKRFYQVYLHDGPDLKKYAREPWMASYYVEVAVNIEFLPNGRRRQLFDEKLERWRQQRESMTP